MEITGRLCTLLLLRSFYSFPHIPLIFTCWSMRRSLIAHALPMRQRQLIISLDSSIYRGLRPGSIQRVVLVRF